MCKAEWILSQWKQRKLTAVKAREEIIFCRDRAAASLNHLGAWQDLQQEAIMERRQRDAKASFEAAKYGFKTLAVVQEWKLQYEPENTLGRTRSIFVAQRTLLRRNTSAETSTF